MNIIKTIKAPLFGPLLFLAVFILLQFQDRPPRLSYRITKVNVGWGYEILWKDRVMIRQDVVPALSTLKGFSTESEASQAAQLVITKLKAGQPPTLSKFEVKQITGG